MPTVIYDSEDARYPQYPLSDRRDSDDPDSSGEDEELETEIDTGSETPLWRVNTNMSIPARPPSVRTDFATTGRRNAYSLDLSPLENIEPVEPETNAEPNERMPDVIQQPALSRSKEPPPRLVLPTAAQEKSATFCPTHSRDSESVKIIHNVKIRDPDTDHVYNVGDLPDFLVNQRSKRYSRRYSYASGMNNSPQRKPGWEPGVDVSTMHVQLNSMGSVVTVVDYNRVKDRTCITDVYPVVDAPMSEVNQDFLNLLNNRPDWSKVRWINVNGLTWETIAPIAHHYKLHALAIEDMVDIPQRTKVDRYPSHLFCSFPLHKLITRQELTKRNATTSWIKSLFSFFHKEDDADPDKEKRKSKFRLSTALTGFDTQFRTQHAGDDVEDIGQRLKAQPMRSIYQWLSPMQRNEFNGKEEQTCSDALAYLRPLAPRNKMIGVEQVSMFLTTDSTVISFFESQGESIVKPILSRLTDKRANTILKESVDPAVLAQAIIDTVIDQCSEVIGAYRLRMNELELEAIVAPSMVYTRDLHMIFAEMTMFRNSIVPITSIISSMREGAGRNNSSTSPHVACEPNMTMKDTISGLVNQGTAGFDTLRARGTEWSEKTSATTEENVSQLSQKSNGATLISNLASMYLADVLDHTLAYTQDLDNMRNYARSTIDLIFNTISIQSSNSVRVLSLVTVVFLPLTFLSGYFGMNFNTFRALDNDVAYYWSVAIPFAVILSVAVSWGWLRDQCRSTVHYIRTNQLKRRESQRRRKRLARRRKKQEELRRASRLV